MTLSTYAATNQPPALPFSTENLLGVNLQAIFFPSYNPISGLVYADSAVPPHYLGTTVAGTSDTEWVYACSTASLAAGAVTLDQYFQATTGGTGGTIPAAVTLPTGQPIAFFWVQKTGSGYAQPE